MFYIKEINVSGLNGMDELKMSFNPLTNIIRGEKGSDASSILLLLQAAVNGATRGLEDIRFDSAEVAVPSGKEVLFTTRKCKKIRRSSRAEKPFFKA